MCGKGVYFSDPKINLGGNIHKACCKCSDCGLKLTSHDAIVTKHGGKKVIVCPTHNKSRLQTHGQPAPKATVVDAPDLMTPEMKAALASAPAGGGEGARPPPPPPPPGGNAGGAPPPTADGSSTLEKVAKIKSNTADKPLEELVEDLNTKEGVDQLRAIAYITDKTQSQDQRLHLAKEEIGLLQSLAHVISNENKDCRIGAIGIVWKLSIEEANRLEIVKPGVGIVEALVFVLENDDRVEAKAKALGAMHNITLATEAQKYIGAYPSMVRSFVSLMTHEHIDVKDRSVGVLWNVATLPDNRKMMADTPDLLPAVGNLLLVDDSGDADIPGKALVVLYYLTLPQECRVAVGAAEGVLPALVYYLKSSSITDEGKIKLTSMLINLSSAAENKIPLGAPSLGLVPELLGILHSTTLIDLKNKICGCLWNLSVAPENRKYMASAPLGILDALSGILASSVNDEPPEDEMEAKSMEETATKSCVIIQNLAGETANHELMIDPKFDLMRTLASVILYKTGDIRLKAFGAIVNLSLSQDTQGAIGGAEGAFAALMSILMDESVGDFRARAAGVLQNLAVDTNNRVLMGADSSLMLIPTTVSYLRFQPKGLLAPSLGILLNMSVSQENKGLIGREDALIPALTKIIATESASVKVKALSLVWSLSSDKPTRDIMKGTPELIEALSAASKEEGDVAKKALGALGNLAPGLIVS